MVLIPANHSIMAKGDTPSAPVGALGFWRGKDRRRLPPTRQRRCAGTMVFIMENHPDRVSNNIDNYGIRSSDYVI